MRSTSTPRATSGLAAPPRSRPSRTRRDGPRGGRFSPPPSIPPALPFPIPRFIPPETVEQSVALDPSGLVHVAGMNGFVSAIAPKTSPSMKIFDFGNAFGGTTTARISPAEVISIYGPGIGPAAAASAAPVNGFYPQTFSGVQVQINGMNMPLLYVSANQINAVVPMEVAIGAGATVRVVNGTAPSPSFPVWIVQAAPQAVPTVLNQDGTINSQTNPAHSNTVITFYATGWQSNFFPLADGQVATAPQAVFSGNCCVSIQDVSSAAVLYAGDAPGIVAGVSRIQHSTRHRLRCGPSRLFRKRRHLRRLSGQSIGLAHALTLL